MTPPIRLNEIVLRRAGFDTGDFEDILLRTSRFKNYGVIAADEVMAMQQDMRKLLPCIASKEACDLFLTAARRLFDATAPREMVDACYHATAVEISQDHAEIIRNIYRTLRIKHVPGDAQAERLLAAAKDLVRDSGVITITLQNQGNGPPGLDVWFIASNLCDAMHKAITKCAEMQPSITARAPNYHTLELICKCEMYVSLGDARIKPVDMADVKRQIAQYLARQTAGAAQ